MPKPNDPKHQVGKKPTLARLLRTPDLSPEDSLKHLARQTEEHFDDYIIIARKKTVAGYALTWAASDRTWARGAMDRVLQDYTITDSCQIEQRNSPGE